MTSKEDRECAALIHKLKLEYGFGTTDLAGYLGLRVHQLRQLPATEGLGGTVLTAVTYLYDLSGRLQQVGIPEPAAWLVTPILYRYTVTPWDLLGRVPAEDLLTLAAGEVTPEVFRATHEPEMWQEHNREYHVVRAADGMLSLVRM